MSYWDTSALAPLLRNEARSAEARSLLAGDPAPVTSWITLVEIPATIARWRREDPTNVALGPEADAAWRVVRDRLGIVGGGDAVVVLAEDILTRRSLRGMDAIQLASWRLSCSPPWGSLVFVTLDRRLGEAALAEGARVLPGLP